MSLEAYFEQQVGQFFVRVGPMPFYNLKKQDVTNS